MISAWYLKCALALSYASKALAVPTPQGPPNGPVPEPVLPDHIRKITTFGERASWSPDGSKIAFMSKAFGDAMEMDIETGELTVLTKYPNAGYLRAQYLPNGDMFLIGAPIFNGTDYTRHHLQEMWVLPQGSQEPVPLGQRIFEGVAISRKQSLIGFTRNWYTYPDLFKEGESAIYTAEICYDEDGKPYITEPKEIIRSDQLSCVYEGQDFRADDTELTYVCIKLDLDPLMASSHGVNLLTGESVTYRDIDGEFNEIEGIYPDGEYALVEHGPDAQILDLWRLRLEPNSNDFVRMTHFSDFEGNKANNPVVSPNQKLVAFQRGYSGGAHGNGDGLFLMDI